ncbi:MAG: proline iminopeptidase, partial [Mesorhizobium sp.]
MWREMAADDRIEVNVDGFKVVAYSFGSSTETVFCLNGGPGLACDYLRESHSCLVDQGYRVVAFDQLGTGASDRPTDTS